MNLANNAIIALNTDFLHCLDEEKYVTLFKKIVFSPVIEAFFRKHSQIYNIPSPKKFPVIFLVCCHVPYSGL